MNQVQIPETFTLFGFKWTVKLDADLIERDNHVGQCQYRNNLILLYPSRSRNEILETFWHEAMHAIRWYTGLQHEGNEMTEEWKTHTQANGIFQILTTMEGDLK